MISAVGASSNYALTRNLTKKRQHLERKQTKLRAPSLRKIAAELARSGHLTAYGRLYVGECARMNAAPAAIRAALRAYWLGRPNF
jgi:hypothetical protein